MAFGTVKMGQKAEQLRKKKEPKKLEVSIPGNENKIDKLDIVYDEQFENNETADGKIYTGGENFFDLT